MLDNIAIADELPPEEFEGDPEALPSPRVGDIVPRDYQVRAFDASLDAWFNEGHRKILAVMATGCGKTVFFSMLIQEFIRRGGKCLVIAHRDELLWQAAKKLKKVSGLESAREKAEERAYLSDSVVLSSTQTMGRQDRLDSWPRDHFSVIIFDESHRVMNPSNQRIAEHFNFAKILGVTATPGRSDKKELGHFFEKCVINYGIVEAVLNGYLVRPVIKTVPMEFDMRGIKSKKGADGNELDKAEVARRLEPFLRELAKKIIEHSARRKTIIFMPTVDSAIHLSGLFKEQGATSDFVCSDERCGDRDGAIEKYSSHDGVQFFCNATLMGEGVDIADISNVVICRLTESWDAYVQWAGRATRILEGVIDGLTTAEERRAAIAASPKPDMQILDFLWLTDKHNIARPAHFLCSDPIVLERMTKSQNGDLLEIQEGAERESLAAVASEAAKHKRKKGRTFDLVKTAVAVGEDELTNYKPRTELDRMPPSKEQIKILENNGVDMTQINCTGLASVWIAKIDRRKQMGLCSFRQMAFLTNLGIKDASMLSQGEATRHIISNQRQKAKPDTLSKRDYLWFKDSDDTHLVLAANDDFAICSMPFGKQGVEYRILDWKNKMRASSIDSGTLLPFDFSRDEDVKTALRGLVNGVLKLGTDAEKFEIHRIQKGRR